MTLKNLSKRWLVAGIILGIVGLNVVMIIASVLINNPLFYQIVAYLLVFELLGILLLAIFGGIFWCIESFVKNPTLKKRLKRCEFFIIFLFISFVLMGVYYYDVYNDPSVPLYLRDTCTAFLSAIMGGMVVDTAIQLKDGSEETEERSLLLHD